MLPLKTLGSTLFFAATFALVGAEPPPVRAFPDAVGFGALTPGGREGKILRVTTLAAKGSGSLDAALRTEGPRIIVFEVGGVIDLAGKSLRITEPFVTVAGQTAPAPGITLIKGGLAVATHDAVVRHLRIRPGEAGKGKASGWEVDGIGCTGAADVIIDHCSTTWATDENLSASGPRFEGETLEDWRKNTSHNVTISHCLIAEGLSNSTHQKVEHSKGTLIHDNATNIAVIGNLYASNKERNPLTKGGVHAVIVNNWIFNPGTHAIHSTLNAPEWGEHPPASSRLAVVGNLLEAGPDTSPRLPLLYNHHSNPLELYMEDNINLDPHGKAVPLISGKNKLTGMMVPAKPLWPENLTPLPAAEVKAHVAKHAGARPWDRDAIDARIIAQALAGEGRIIDSEAEAGGYPEVAPTRAEFRPEDWDLATMEPRKPF